MEKFDIKRIIRWVNIIGVMVIGILLLCLIMKNYFPAEWSFITPHKKGDFVRVGNMHLNHHISDPVLLDDGRVLFAGSEKSEVYEPKTRRFRVIENNGFVLNKDMIALKLKNKNVLFLGGYSYSKDKVSNDTYIFNMQTDKFELGPKMITGRKYHSAILLDDGRVFVAGGINDSDKRVYLKSTEFYNPKTNKFEKGPDLPETMFDFGITTDNHYIYIWK